MKNLLLNSLKYFGIFFSLLASAQKKIVVLGSSTAAGTGASNYSNSWVGKYTAYLTGLNAGNQVYNLAVNGYSTYQMMPTSVNGGVPGNITSAWQYHPNIIIMNLPTNDAAYSVPIGVTMARFRLFRDTATAMGAQFWITTTQPRNLDATGRQLLNDTRDSIIAQFGAYVLDFWTTVANADGSINPIYSAGDGVHLNDSGHDILYQRAKAQTSLNAVLPVSLSKFTAIAEATRVLLNWEINTNGETVAQKVERSRDSQSFVEIGSFAPSNASTSFSFTDPQPLPGFNYYRLKFITTAGAKYSQVLRLSVGDQNAQFALLPNTTTGSEIKILWNSPTAQTGELYLRDINSKDLLTKRVTLPAGATLQSLQLPPSLQKGLYIVTFRGTGFQKSCKLIVQ